MDEETYDRDLLIVEPPKRPRLDENIAGNVDAPEGNTEAAGADERLEEGEESECPICFEPWTCSGRHRLVSLRCGHLFGRLCIEKWLANNNRRQCPTCKARAEKSDIRELYATKKIVAVDQERIDVLQKQVEEERRLRKIAADREASTQLLLLAAKSEIIGLKEEIARLRLSAMLPGAHERRKFSFWRQLSLDDKNGNSAASGQCRALYIDDHYKAALIGRMTPARTGLVQVSLADARSPTLFIPTGHQRAIKGISGSPFMDGLVGSVGLDGRLSVASLQTASVIAEVELGGAAGWSVAWDRGRRNQVYVGLANRKVAVVDLRQPKGLMGQLQIDDASLPPLPVHSLYSTSEGVLVGATMNGVFSGDPNDPNSQLQTRALNLSGSCASLSSHQPSATFLTVFRQADPKASAKAAVFSADGPDQEFQTVRVFDSASPCTRLSGSALFSDSADNKLTAALVDEVTAGLHLWDIEDGSFRDALPCNTKSSILDVGYGAGGVLLGLSEQQLFLYKC